jgi:POT family proton-dependent oligopeptide transporter
MLSIFKHPKGLYFLFFTEMWERFSYYGMRGLLKLYMVNYLFITLRQHLQGKAYDTPGGDKTIFGWETIRKLLPTVSPESVAQCVTDKFTALTNSDVVSNIAPMAADLARSVAEQTCMATPQASVLYGWYTGLVYMTPILGGLIADRYLGQRKTVIVGAIFMAVGQFMMASEACFFIALLMLIIGNGAFKPNISTQVGSLYPKGDERKDSAFTLFYMGINLGALICNLICGTLAATRGWNWGFGAAGVGMIIGLCVYLAGLRYTKPHPNSEVASNPQTDEDKSKPLNRAQWGQVGALVALCTLNIVFWMVYEQQGNTMQTWADEQTVWPVVLGFQIPSTWYQSLNPLLIVLMAPLFDMIWSWQRDKGKEPSTIMKMAIGCFLLGGSFIVMIIGAKVVGSDKGSLMWPVLCVAILSIGELFLSPVGLALVTKVSPAKIVSMMMGVWLASSFFGNILSGYVGQLYTTMDKEYFFLILMVLGVGVGFLMLAVRKPLTKAMGEEKV